MAKKKKRRRPSMITKAINIGVLGLAFSHALSLLMQGKWGAIVSDYSVGFAGNPQTGSAPSGNFEMARATKAYGPIVAAVLLKKAISYVRRMTRV